MRAGVPYRVVGGVKFYDRREVKDISAYLARAREPRRRGELAARREHAQARRRRHVDQPGGRVRAGRGRDLPRRAGRGGRRRGCTGKALGGVRELLELMTGLDGDRRRRRRAARSKAILEQTGYLAELEAERSIEARGRIENLQELVGVCREFDEALDAGDISRPARDRRRGHGRCRRRRARRRRRDPRRARPDAGVPRGDLAGHRPRRCRPRWRAERGHADDPAHRQGPRVPRRVPDRARGRRVPARAQPRRPRRARRGAAPLLRRHHPGPRAPLPVPRVEPHAVRRHRLLPTQPVPGRDPRGAGVGARVRPGKRRGSTFGAGGARTAGVDLPPS